MVRGNDFRHNPDYATQTSKVAPKWSGVAENIAINSSVAGANTGLLNSPGHRRNMLSPGATHMGIGIVKAANGQIWITENFVATSENLATTE